MPTLKKPAYLLHNATGQARVRIDGKDHYLGRFGTPDSHDRYDELITEWCCKNGNVRSANLTIDELAILFIDHAEKYHRKNGKPTGEANNVCNALRFLIQAYGRLRIRRFGPLKLKEVRESMIDSGLCRTSINRHVGRIKLMFRWGVENEYVPADVYQSVVAVAGLKRGRTDAKELKPVRDTE